MYGSVATVGASVFVDGTAKSYSLGSSEVADESLLVECRGYHCRRDGTAGLRVLDLCKRVTCRRRLVKSNGHMT